MCHAQVGSAIVPNPPTHQQPPVVASAAPAAPLLADLPPRWPAALRADLGRRRDVLLGFAAASGCDQVLDLARPDHRHLVAQVVAGTSDGRNEGGFDAVVSTAGFARFADLSAAINAVDALVRPDAVWLACEPGYRPGLAAMLVASLGVLLPPARGVHLARDLPATMRAHGLIVTDIERFTMPTLLWPLRPFVQLRAVRASSFGPGGGS